MKLYKVPTAPPGERWHASKTGLKNFGEVEMPKLGRGAMAEFLNANEAQVALADYSEPDLDPLERAELRAAAIAVASVTTQPRYESPLSASSVIAGIDAGMCAAAIRQMDGVNLAKVAGACIERISQVSF
jgi:hypothetical protein